jgi:hypothetical protein
MTQDSLFAAGPAPDDELLIAVYAKQQRTLDDLPYTPEFEALCAALGLPAGSDPRRELFHHLHNLRKASRLPRLGRAVTPPPRIAPEHEALLTQLVEAAVGRLSLRDQLPYTPAFDQLVSAFNARAGLALPPHDVWRIIAKLAK